VEKTLETTIRTTIGKYPTKKVLLWVALVSIIMLFASLTSAYIVRQAEGNWVKFDLPSLFWVSTALIIMSSVSMNWALSSAKKNRPAGIKSGINITTLLGIGFVITQFQAWGSLVDQKIFFTGNPSGSFLYVLTGLHVVHLLGGLIYLFIVLLGAYREKYNSNNILGMELCATYWHFLDGLWVYLFLFLLFIR
jgi:cytochrome c oxidase subunit III